MADQLYLSLWFPNFRLEALPEKLVSVLQQFALIAATPQPNGKSAAASKRITAASAYPLGFSESPTWQRIYVNDDRAETTDDALIENAVAEATEQLYDDMAYEFEMKWNLWAPVSAHTAAQTQEELAAGLDLVWKQQPSTVRVLGFGPGFDDASFSQNGHIRVDFGLDTPWVFDEETTPDAATHTPALLDPRADPNQARTAAGYIRKNVEMLLAFTLSVEKHCGISSRLLWTESGEPLAEKLIATLQRLT